MGESGQVEVATFGGGCFWCTEAFFRELKGVTDVVSGYSGGVLKNPTYQAVLTGATGHAEVVQITFDPEAISFDELLEVFWKTHDPTTLNRQGPDFGTQYRSVVFYHNERQKDLAEHYKAKLNASGAFRAPIVTEISPFTAFYPAEKYHQEFYERNPRQSYCRAVIRPKMEKFKRVFKDKLKSEESPSQEKGPRAPEKTSGGESDADTWDGKKVIKTDAEWKEQLTRMQFSVTRRKGTEPAFKNAYWRNKREGTYRCVCCGLPLFDSGSKYKSGTGWPSFSRPIDPRHLGADADYELFMVRTELKCVRCDAHLGHVFDDGPPPTGLRFCMNSAALSFEEAKAVSEGEAGPGVEKGRGGSAASKPPRE